MLVKFDKLILSKALKYIRILSFIFFYLKTNHKIYIADFDMRL